MGGFDGESRTSSCERYDASRNQWELVASMHDVRSDASAVAVAGRIYVMGGFTGLDVLDTVEFYDPTSDSWTRVRSMSTPRSGLKAVVHGDDVYVMGGFDGAHRLNSAERMDVRTGRWSELPSMVFPRSNFVAALLEGSIYVAGGFNGTTTASVVERYDIEALQWHRATDLSITCSAAAAFVYHDVPNARRCISSVFRRATEQRKEERLATAALALLHYQTSSRGSARHLSLAKRPSNAVSPGSPVHVSS
ncbi:uncharacterized protein LOC144144729 [Haemaphysalis longicornis]